MQISCIPDKGKNSYFDTMFYHLYHVQGADGLVKNKYFWNAKCHIYFKEWTEICHVKDTFILAVENIPLCFSINKNVLDLHVSTKSNKMKKMSKAMSN